MTPDAVEQEWGLLKAQLYRKAKWQDLTWTQIHGLYTSTCPNVLHLMDLLMTIPVANAECERGFSMMKVTKNEYRTRIRTPVLTDILRIQMSSPTASSSTLWRLLSCGTRTVAGPDMLTTAVVEKVRMKLSCLTLTLTCAQMGSFSIWRRSVCHHHHLLAICHQHRAHLVTRRPVT